MTSYQNTDRQLMSPIQSGFNLQVLSMSMKDIVNIALVDKPVSLFKSYKQEEEKTIDILMLMLLKFQDFFNCKSKMDKSQLVETAHLVIHKFRHLNFYDIGMCLKEAKMNEKIYDRIDGNMILEWLMKYDITRTGMIVTKRQEQDRQNNNDCKNLAERTSIQTLKDFLS